MTRPTRAELLVLLAILALAALTRLPGIAERGRWDADQGTDMRVLRALVVDGEVPLLGPRTSIGTFHHGAVYYDLLAPAAFLSNADPVAVTVEIALFGIAAVAGTWWLGRLLGGPLAAAAAGLLAAVSPAGIDESTFIWNPNLIAAAAALAYAATIQARRTGRARWWVLAGLGAMVTMQCHVLGAVIVLPIAWAWASDLRRRRGTGLSTRGPLAGGLGAVLVIAIGYVQLAIHELTTGFTETRAILDYLGGGAGEAAMGAGGRILVVGLRAVTWPVAGLVTDRVGLSLLAAIVVAGLATAAVVVTRRWRPPAGIDTGGARWLVGALLVSVVLLALFASSLATVTPELPNDHYHAFLDPLVLALVGAGVARLAASPVAAATSATTRSGGMGRLAAGVATVVLAGIAVTAWPPARAADGGWPAADAAAARVLDRLGAAPVETSLAPDPLALDGIPAFKNDNALRFPLERRGAVLVPDAGPDILPPSDARILVLVCDPLFDAVVGAPCGGPAEDAWLAAWARPAGELALVDRFDAGSRRIISVYRAP